MSDAYNQMKVGMQAASVMGKMNQLNPFEEDKKEQTKKPLLDKPKPPKVPQRASQEDTWERDYKDATIKKQQLFTKYSERNEAIRQGKSVGKMEYLLRNEAQNLEFALKRLENQIKYFEEVVDDPNTDYGKVFVNKRTNQTVLEMRGKDFIKLRDECQPAFEMISRGTTDIRENIENQRRRQQIIRDVGQDTELID